MNFQEEFIFWKLAHYFISAKEYRMIQLSGDQKELWLEKIENKNAQVIRLLLHNLDWSNWMQRDIELTAGNGERIRKKFARRELSVVNIYVSQYPPVDDYEFRIAEPFQDPRLNKIKVTTFIAERSNYQELFHTIGELFQEPLSLGEYRDYALEEIEKIKHRALSIAHNQAKKEKAVFDYGKPLFTYAFMLIQVTVFFFLEANGGSTNTSTLIKFGAKFNPLIIEGEWWRFFTPIILHIGIFHLLMNTLALYYLGTLVERIFGNGRFLFIYLLAGFTGSLASFVWSSSLSAGASGAIFGCFGALLYFGFMYPSLFFRTMGLNIIIVLAFNLIFGFTVPGIDNAGHIGGLIGGFAASGIVHLPGKRKLLVQSIFLAGSVFAITALMNYGYGEETRNIDEASLSILAQHHIQNKEYWRAYEALKQFSDSHSVSPETLFMLSFAEIKVEKWDEAREHLHKVIEMEPEFDEAHYNLALLYMDVNNFSKAKEYAENAVRLKPERKEYQEILAKINGQ